MKGLPPRRTKSVGSDVGIPQKKNSENFMRVSFRWRVRCRVSSHSVWSKYYTLATRCFRSWIEGLLGSNTAKLYLYWNHGSAIRRSYSGSCRCRNTSSKKDFYFPIYYQEPIADNEGTTEYGYVAEWRVQERRIGFRYPVLQRNTYKNQEKIDGLMPAMLRCLWRGKAFTDLLVE